MIIQDLLDFKKPATIILDMTVNIGFFNTIWWGGHWAVRVLTPKIIVFCQITQIS